ncbi:helix-turn-helix domain-containing protein [Pontivivens nitratireducens]|uniref:helix-turn-helix domain-containing protein n=1 Tax=Pontivivens nitratireducens TaxID=2758038 RepID=UPI00163B3BE1|nr:helix-turn-helix domain-containing protein [Pontibrevibacter nitratireducens]
MHTNAGQGRLGIDVAWDTDGTLSGFDSYEVTLGDQLRGERATKGKSLLDVQRDLRIKAAYIAAIENCDLEVFPNRGFVAGYVRSYARYLGLAPEEIYQRFCFHSGFNGVNADIQGRHVQGRAGATAQSRVVSHKIDLKNDPLSRGKLSGPVAESGFDLRALLGGMLSLFVMAGLLGGVGYGGWRVLQEVQRVELAPVSQTPVVADEGVTLATVAPDESDITTRAATSTVERDAALERLYRPEPLVPVMAPRDGPIASIDPEQVGSFANRITNDLVPEQETLVAANMDALPPNAAELLASVEMPPVPPVVSVIASQAAWIRVSQADGATLFETILAAGESYVVPEGVDSPELRAGNSGSVFLSVGDQLFGPLGNGPRVAKQVSLLAEDIPQVWSLAEPTAEQSAALQGALISTAERTARATD